MLNQRAALNGNADSEPEHGHGHALDHVQNKHHVSTTAAALSTGSATATTPHLSGTLITRPYESKLARSFLSFHALLFVDAYFCFASE